MQRSVNIQRKIQKIRTFQRLSKRKIFVSLYTMRAMHKQKHAMTSSLKRIDQHIFRSMQESRNAFLKQESTTSYDFTLKRLCHMKTIYARKQQDIDVSLLEAQKQLSHHISQFRVIRKLIRDRYRDLTPHHDHD